MLASFKSMKPGQRLELGTCLAGLLESGLISPTQQQRLSRIDHGGEEEHHPLVRISEQGWQSALPPHPPLTLEYLTRWLAESCDMEYVRIDPLRIDAEAVTGTVSQAYASRFCFLPIEVSEQVLTVATAEPWIDDWVPELSRILQRRIRRLLASPLDIARYQNEFYGLSRSIFGAARNKGTSELSAVQNFEQLTELGRGGEPDANDQHIVHIVDWLLQYAYEQRASDIHLEPRRERSHIRFRIDGVLHEVNDVPTAVLGAITSRLKSLGRMDVTDRRRPQDGRLKTRSPAGDEMELRLSTMPTAFGEKMVLRIFDPNVLRQGFADLGLSRHDHQLWERMTHSPNGIILVTGPTGSGKTTTLYSALRSLARPEVNICTIEDPIEMVEEQFNQMQVQTQIDVDFASGIRTLLRQDPDIIMIGEIRDRAPAEIAIQAALTGHLVLSTLHTNDAPSAITRLLDIGIEPYLISATLQGVVAQRLVRILCPDCKRPGEIDPGVWRALTRPADIARPKRIFHPTGCDECRHTGYLGRTGIYEFLCLDKDLRHAIGPGVETAMLRELALRAGMKTLRLSGALKIAAGITTPEEVLAVAPASADADEHADARPVFSGGV